jgi:hypothetical protein
MAQADDLEFQRFVSMVRQFGWEVSQQKIDGEWLLITAQKKRPPQPPQAAPGAPITPGAS